MLRRVLLFAVTGVGFGAAVASSGQAFIFEQVAVDGQAGVGFIDATVRPAIADNGEVVFVASAAGASGDRLWQGNGSALANVDLAPSQLDQVLSVAVRSAGDVAFIAKRTAGADSYQGVYTTSVPGGVITTMHESLLGFFATDGPPRPNVSMSENGTVAFSTLSSSVSAGSIWRGAVGGPAVALRNWSGTYFNTQVVDVNNAGQVPVQMEYGDPTLGLSRGILIFEQPGDTLATIDTAIEKTSVGIQPMPSINSAGQVAFVLNSSPTLTFYTVPDDSSSPILSQVTLSPGIYVSNPTPFGAPPVLTQMVDGSTGMTNFNNVELNDAGQFVFEASYNGESGVFVGPDPVADRVLLTGDPIAPGDPHVWSIVKLGEINDQQQFTLLTSVFGGDQQVWRVSVPEPTSAALLLGMAPMAAFLRRVRR